MSSPVGNFRELTSALEANRPLPPPVVVWLHDGCVRFAAGDADSLDIALGLRGRGIDLPAAAYARQTRNIALTGAFALVDGATPWVRCRELSRIIRRFESTAWPRMRHLDFPPSRLTPVQTHLFHAFRACDRVPKSARHLYELLK